MAAPEHAETVGNEDNLDENGEPLPEVTCQVCGWHGGVSALLGVDPEEDTTMWCPRCRSSMWVYD